MNEVSRSPNCSLCKVEPIEGGSQNPMCRKCARQIVGPLSDGWLTYLNMYRADRRFRAGVGPNCDRSAIVVTHPEWQFKLTVPGPDGGSIDLAAGLVVGPDAARAFFVRRDGRRNLMTLYGPPTLLPLYSKGHRFDPSVVAEAAVACADLMVWGAAAEAFEGGLRTCPGCRGHYFLETGCERCLSNEST